ncbi:MAG: HAD family hydrolase [Rhizobiaceae bacterium]|nr:HAD family hydrolase [Rhizobiaceae bacterium]
MLAIKGILFDKDGTLVDFNATWFGVADYLALEASEGDRWKADRMLAAAGYDFATKMFKADSIFAAGSNLDVVELWFPKLTEAEQLAEVARFNEITAIQGSQRAVALPNIPETLAKLHGANYRMAVATNDSTSGAEKTLEALRISQFFDAAYGYDAVARSKPAPDTIYAFSDLTGLKPAELMMIGDNRHDLEMGRAAGVGRTVGVLSGTGTRETLAPLADAVLESVADLPGYLKEQASA